MQMTRLLYDYQKYATKWLLDMENTWKCAILADDMGLGKTTDIIAHVIYTYQQHPNLGKTLIVCPLSLLDMWKKEIHNTTTLKNDQVIIYYGENKNMLFFDSNDINSKIVLTTYETLKSELQYFYKHYPKIKKNLKFYKSDDNNDNKKKKQLINEIQTKKNNNTNANQSSFNNNNNSITLPTTTINSQLQHLCYIKNEKLFNKKKLTNNNNDDDDFTTINNSERVNSSSTELLTYKLTTLTKNKQKNNNDYNKFLQSSLSKQLLLIKKKRKKILVENCFGPLLLSLYNRTINSNYSNNLLLENNNDDDDDDNKKIYYLKNFPLLSTQWYRVILDEAHKIRSLKSQTTFAVHLLKTTCRICVTGSPINNSIYDLTALAIWMDIDPYCDINWWTKNFNSKRSLENWCNIFILMRQKQNLIKLPSVNEFIVYIDFLEQDKILYNYIEEYSKKNIMDNNIILTWLLKQRQICCHPLIILGRAFTTMLLELNDNNDEIVKNDNYNERVNKLLKFGINKINKLPLNIRALMHNVWNFYMQDFFIPLLQSSINCEQQQQHPCNTFIKKNCLQPSPKIIYIIDHIKKCLETDPFAKFIIFSQWTSYLDLIHYFLLKEFKKDEISRFDGSMNITQRNISINNFKTIANNKIFISSLQTGGVGLHLVDANEMIITDPWYNPEIEKQAINRMNRLGQERTMRVVKIIMSSSIECNVNNIANKKTLLTNDLLKKNSSYLQNIL